MNSVARSLALRALHRFQRPAAAAVGKKAAAYSTAQRLAAYRYRSDAGYLLVPLVAVGAGVWLITTAATRYFMTPHRQQRTTAAAAAAGAGAGAPVAEGPRR